MEPGIRCHATASLDPALKPRRLGLLLLLCVLAGLSAGCIWLRYLAFKNQLGHLDRYVRLSDTNGLTVTFLKPVLYGDDLFVIMSDRPSLRVTNGNRAVWTWKYQKFQPTTNTEPGDFSLSFDVLLEKSKINGLRFPKGFLAVIPKEMITGFFRSVGQAKVDRKSGSATVDWVDGGPDEQVQPILQTQLLTLLGAPFYVSESNRTYSCLYKYEFAGTPSHRAWAKFIFDGGGQLTFSEGAWGNVGWNLTNKPGREGMLVGLALVPDPSRRAGLELEPRLAEACVGRYRNDRGEILAIGRDGRFFGADGGLTTPELEKRGWWMLLPESPTHFFSLGRDLQFTFDRDPHGNVKGCRVGEHGFDMWYAKISDQAPVTAEPVRLAPHTCDAYPGRYQAAWDGSLSTIRLDHDQLFWGDNRLYPSSETDFFFKLVDCPLTFLKNEKGEVTKFVLHYRGTDLEVKRLR